MSQKLFVVLLLEQKPHFLEALLEARRVYKPRSEPEKVVCSSTLGAKAAVSLGLVAGEASL